jgi:hypothetical protein
VKIRADEHVSPEIVEAINKLALGSNHSLDSVFSAGQRGAADVPWVTRFARDGGNVILSADTDFHKKPHQIAAVHDLGLMVIELPTRWANSRCRIQAAHILYWWGCIEETIESARPRDFLRVPWGFPEKQELQRRTVNYEQARKKVRKASRRQSPR